MEEVHIDVGAHLLDYVHLSEMCLNSVIILNMLIFQQFSITGKMDMLLGLYS